MFEATGISREGRVMLGVNAAIRGLGNQYADGTERIEIHVSTDRATGLPYKCGTRVPIVLHIDGESYQAGLRATANNDYVWICPNVYAKNGAPKRLADVVAQAGFKKNDRILLEVTGADIRMTAAGAP